MCNPGSQKSLSDTLGFYFPIWLEEHKPYSLKN